MDEDETALSGAPGAAPHAVGGVSARSVATIGPHITLPAQRPLSAVATAAMRMVPTAEEAETEERARLLRQLRDIAFATEDFDFAASASEQLGGSSLFGFGFGGEYARGSGGRGAVHHAPPHDAAEPHFPPSEDAALRVEGRPETPPLESPFDDLYESVSFVFLFTVTF